MNSNLENYFEPFREGVCGHDQTFDGPYGQKNILYADWVASGRFYQPIEDHIQKYITPFVANTHTETTVTGTTMTRAYEHAKRKIKSHVNACPLDNLVFCGSGMTGAIAKLQRILGLKVPERFDTYLESHHEEKSFRKLANRKKRINEKYKFKENEKPIVFITHMEHHSNHTSWLETICDLEIIGADEQGLVSLESFGQLLEQYKDRKYKIASVTACSNLTGIDTPYHEIAKMVHQYDGLCFVDFACSAPYVDIDMHPEEEGTHLDAIFFSPHKFLGGPGSAGVLIFHSALYNNRCPDIPGGGTVTFTTPWHMHDYIDNIEVREDGGTPPFIQGIRAAMAVMLKEEMGTAKIEARENELIALFFEEVEAIDGIHIMAPHIKERHGAISIHTGDIHYNLVTRVLNDKYGIQVRGGCVCAGTYGHYLLDIDEKVSNSIRKEIHSGNNLVKPGFVRISIHPTMTEADVYTITHALKDIFDNRQYWKEQYIYNPLKNEFDHKDLNAVDFEKELEKAIWTIPFTTKKDTNLEWS